MQMNNMRWLDFQVHVLMFSAEILQKSINPDMIIIVLNTVMVTIIKSTVHPGTINIILYSIYYKPISSDYDRHHPCCYHDDVVLGHVGGQLVHVAPVGGLLIRNNNIGGQNLQHAHVRGKRGAGRVRTQQKDSLNTSLKAGHVQIMKSVDWPVKYAVDQVDSSFLSIRGVFSEYRKYGVCSHSITCCSL